MNIVFLYTFFSFLGRFIKCQIQHFAGNILYKHKLKYILIVRKLYDTDPAYYLREKSIDFHSCESIVSTHFNDIKLIFHRLRRPFCGLNNSFQQYYYDVDLCSNMHELRIVADVCTCKVLIISVSQECFTSLCTS